ncbi:hypothetical protein CEE34_07715 [Candidatus Aerophobetes bacterium Ae_b3a]|nr:MAG: hypothetical protein CEE34_07715 [Candidatus Aerophobetes bacterium Ae_b3a]
MKLNSLISSLSGNQFAIKKGLEEDGGILILLPHELNISENRIHNVGRIDVKNKLLGLALNLNKYNRSLRTATAEFRENIENLKVPPVDLNNMQKGQMLEKAKSQFKNHLSEIKTFGTRLMNDIEDVLVDVRFYIKKDKSIISPAILQRRVRKEELERWREKDRPELRKEIESVREKVEKEGRNSA